jgi:hypothetical protein
LSGQVGRIVLLVAEIPATEGLKMIYKGYTIKRGERGYLEVADSTGNICGLFSLVREAKYFINKAAA